MAGQIAVKTTSLGAPAGLSGIGLRLFPQDGRRALSAAAGSVLIVIAAVLVLDAAVFRSQLPAWYVADLQALSAHGLLAVSLKSALSEVWRAVLMVGLLAWPVLRGGKPSAAYCIVAVVAAQFLLTWPAVLAAPLYAGLRYWAIGCVWGWLFWRHGWLCAVAAHCSVHLLLDPLLRSAL